METPPNYVTVAGFRRSPSKDFHLRLDARINRRDGRVDTQIFSAWIEQPRSSMCTRAITAEGRPWKVNVSLAAVGWQSELDARISAPSVSIALCRRRRRRRSLVSQSAIGARAVGFVRFGDCRSVTSIAIATRRTRVRANLSKCRRVSRNCKFFVRKFCPALYSLFPFAPRGDRIEEFDRSFVASNRDTDRLSYRSPTRDEKRRRCRSLCGIIANITRSSRAADIMKSKTSENFIASESNGVKRDQQLKQKQLKSGKRLFSHRIKTAQSETITLENDAELYLTVRKTACSGCLESSRFAFAILRLYRAAVFFRSD